MVVFNYGKDLYFKIDDATGSLTDISAYVNNVTFSNAPELFDVTRLNDSGSAWQQGFANQTISFNFFVNSTSDAIFGPLLIRTSTLKTASYKNGEYWYTGEWMPQNVEFSGDSKSLIMGSCDLVVDGLVTRTSVTPT